MHKDLLNVRHHLYCAKEQIDWGSGPAFLSRPLDESLLSVEPQVSSEREDKSPELSFSNFTKQQSQLD